jgi:predicted ATPase
VLRGVERSVRIFQVGLGSFPPFRARRSSNLAGSVSTLIGRDSLVAGVCDLVLAHRVVTLTGVGGVGKTRLALAVAHAVETEFDAVLFVGLLEVDDDGGVLSAVATTLDSPTHGVDSVLTALSQRRVLLVLDNCEHVLDGVADVVEWLVRRAFGCHILAMSREVLAVDGERVMPVPTLGYGGPGRCLPSSYSLRAVRRDDPSHLRAGRELGRAFRCMFALRFRNISALRALATGGDARELGEDSTRPAQRRDADHAKHCRLGHHPRRTRSRRA